MVSMKEVGGQQIVDNGLDACGADLLDVIHAQDAAHDGEQHQRNHAELDEVQEDRAEGLDVSLGKGCVTAQQNAGDDCQDQCDEDLGSKGHFLFHIEVSFSKICKFSIPSIRIFCN